MYLWGWLLGNLYLGSGLRRRESWGWLVMLVSVSMREGKGIEAKHSSTSSPKRNMATKKQDKRKHRKNKN
jgi:hypothetical protein